MPSLWLYLGIQTALALLSTCFGIFIPGFFVTRFIPIKKFTPIARFCLSIALGMALFGLQGYALGYLHLRMGSYVYLLLSGAGFMYLWRELLTFFTSVGREMKKLPKIITILIVIGVLLQSFQMFGNGLPQRDGMSFWRTNGYDGMFHLALIESLKTTFPPVEPSSQGLHVVNYHYWSDLIQSEEGRLFGIATPFIFFQWTPLLVATVTALSLISLLQVLTESMPERMRTTVIVCALLFLFLGSDAGWIFPKYLHGVWSFEYPAIDNGPTQFLNVPHTFGKLFFYVVSLVILYWIRERKNETLIAAVFLAAVTFGLKIYFGIALAIGLLGIYLVEGVETVFKIAKGSRAGINHLLFLFGSGIFFLLLVGVIYLPVNRHAGGLSWYPLEWPKLLVNKQNFDWTTLNYKIAIAAYLHDEKKIILYNTVLLLVGFVTIHGARMLGLVITPSTFKILGKKGVVFFVVPVLICTVLGFTTLQDSGSFNVFNFFAVSFSFLIISLAFWCAQLFEKSRILGGVFIFLILAFSLPRSVYETMTMITRYQTGYDRVHVSKEDLEAYAFMKNTPSVTTIASSLGDSFESKSTYTTAFTGKPVYFAGKYLLETHNQPFEQKERSLRELFQSTTVQDIRSKAEGMSISTILIHEDTASTPAEEVLLKNKSTAIFSNANVSIFDVRKL